MDTEVKFRVLANHSRIPSKSRLRAYLVRDDWNDWNKFRTTFWLVIFDEQGRLHEPGSVKIGATSIARRDGRPSLPTSFSGLGPEFFSVGQSGEYYRTLGTLRPPLRNAILQGLRDIVDQPDLMRKALKHEVARESLFRSVTKSSVLGQFRRLLRGRTELTPFKFEFRTTPSSLRNWKLPPLEFQVTPGSLPPTNVHAIIGRNGVGKSHLLHTMASSLCTKRSRRTAGFASLKGNHESDIFASVVSVSFSAFDEFPILEQQSEYEIGVKYYYIGLTKKVGGESARATKTPKDLADEFVSSVLACVRGPRLPIWLRILKSLSTDPIFEQAAVHRLAVRIPQNRLAAGALSLFKSLSSGHKTVLLTSTRLVEVVEERTLILIDEPESHLHPPLTSAFVRAVSELMTHRNAVAIIATHSPVVLQEIPRACVWVIRRSGRNIEADRPSTETFGESVGVLTREVFRLEALESGFHQMLRSAVQQEGSLKKALDAFGGALGGEARAVLQVLSASPKGLSCD